MTLHLLRPYEQHPRALTWRSRCTCGMAGFWRGSPDRAASDWRKHAEGDDSNMDRNASLRREEAP